MWFLPILYTEVALSFDKSTKHQLVITGNSLHTFSLSPSIETHNFTRSCGHKLWIKTLRWIDDTYDLIEQSWRQIYSHSASLCSFYQANCDCLFQFRNGGRKQHGSCVIESWAPSRYFELTAIAKRQAAGQEPSWSCLSHSFICYFLIVRSVFQPLGSTLVFLCTLYKFRSCCLFSKK